MNKKITTLEMECAIAQYLKPNLVVPNVWWSFFTHECDLISLSKSGYITEIEIKISKADLIKDKQKRHKHIDGNKHRGNKIKFLYFAIPKYLEEFIEHIPEHAGIITVQRLNNGHLFCSRKRYPKKQSDYKFSEEERVKLLEIMALRIWNLKKKLAKYKRGFNL